MSHFGIGNILNGLVHLGSFAIVILAIAVWSLIWKGFALWYAARNYQKKWFIALIILNTAGILEIIYLLFFRRDKREGVTKSLFNNPLPDPDEADAKPVVAETTGA